MLVSDACKELVNKMSMEIGRVNIYDIYQPCFENMATINRARYIGCLENNLFPKCIFFTSLSAQFSLSHTHTHSLTHTLSHTLSLSLSHTLTLSHVHTHIHTPSLSLSYTHSPSLPGTQSRTYCWKILVSTLDQMAASMTMLRESTLTIQRYIYTL